MAKVYDGAMIDTSQAFREIGVDPNTVLRDGLTEEGYMTWVNDFKLGRKFVPWPSEEVGEHILKVYRNELLYGPQNVGVDED